MAESNISQEMLNAECEAKRFLIKVKTYKKATKGNAYKKSYSKEHSAVKRASMDLSRALSEIRRPKSLERA